MRIWRDIDARFAALAAALVLYGIGGSPTPDDPGAIEAIIGLLLALSVSFPGAGPRLSFAPLLVFGLTIPLGIAVYAAHLPDAVIRDVIPFLFLCLPFFVAPEKHASAFIHLCMIVGVLFAARVLGQGLDIFPARVELLYLANSPLVIAGAICGLGKAGMDIYRRDISVHSLLFFSGGLICLLAMLIDVQRATIAAVVLSLGVLAAAGTIRAPQRMLWPLVIGGIAIAASHEIIFSAWHSMATKTALVGVNARWQELMAVHHHLAGNWGRALFGIGWGGMFDSPAVGGWRVPYTHSLLSYMLLKTGWTGLCLTLIALGACARKILIHPSLLALALFWAILIPVFFYASYKSLDFGLVLVLALLLPRGIDRIRS